MKTINCAECKAEFNYEPPKGYPDKRKYCDPCGVKKNEQYKATQASSEDAKPEVETIRPGLPLKEEPKATPVGVKPRDNGFALTIGNVRSNALASAIECLKMETKEDRDRLDVWKMAKAFEQYILTGE